MSGLWLWPIRFSPLLYKWDFHSFPAFAADWSNAGTEPDWVVGGARSWVINLVRLYCQSLFLSVFLFLPALRECECSAAWVWGDLAGKWEDNLCLAAQARPRINIREGMETLLLNVPNSKWILWKVGGEADYGMDPVVVLADYRSSVSKMTFQLASELGPH